MLTSIVRYFGQQDRGLLLSQASHGNLQTYIDENDSFIDLHQRMIWCRQLTEAIMHIHSHGVIHFDLRPRNILVHETKPGSRDLLLCDFGGATCDEMGLDGAAFLTVLSTILLSEFNLFPRSIYSASDLSFTPF